MARADEWLPDWARSARDTAGRLLPNRFVRIALGLLIAVGLAFIVRRMVENRERKRAALGDTARADALPAGEARRIDDHQDRVMPLLTEHGALEPLAPPTVAQAMTDTNPNETQRQASQESRAQKYPLLATPHIHLSGPVDQGMYQRFRDDLANAPAEGTLVIAISTLGGDPEVARLMGDDVRLLREYNDREILFLGKVAVYSAGATFMAAFPTDKRFLTKGTRIMIHERLMTSTINLSGPLKTLTATLRAKLHEIEHSVKIEEEGFRDLVAGSKIDFEEVCRRAPENWYIDAEEARDMGLVLDVI